jgi:hypothetical protein
MRPSLNNLTPVKGLWFSLLALSCSETPATGHSRAMDIVSAEPVAVAIAPAPECKHGGSFPSSVDLNLTSLPTEPCPDLRLTADGEEVVVTAAARRKVLHSDYLMRHVGETHTVIVVFTEEAPSVASSDAALKDKLIRRTVRQECVSTAAGIDVMDAVFFDLPQHASDDSFLPTLSAVKVTLSWRQLWLLAEHPFVARLEPNFHSFHEWAGGPAPALPCHCPAAEDEPASKLTRLERWQGQKLLMIEFTEPTAADAAKTLRTLDTTEDVLLGYQATLEGVHHLSCLRRTLDQVLTEDPISGSAGAGWFIDAQFLPPIGPPLGWHTQTQLGLTWEEARALARSPLVVQMWSEPALDPGPTGGCPLDFSQPIVAPECPTRREDGSRKLDATLAKLRANAGTMGVLPISITVQGGATVCPAPPCPSGDERCPEVELQFAYYEAQNRAAQTCVRSFIVELGSTVNGQPTWINVLSANLTWQQIDQLATHPHVVSISYAGYQMQSQAI